MNVAELVAAAQVSVLTPQNSNYGIKAKELYLLLHSIALRNIIILQPEHTEITTSLTTCQLVWGKLYR